jgi:uncharacterized membrane protein YGL010W
MPTPFRPALTLLVQYAEYHRDPRNIQTHLVGVPLIVLALGVLLAAPQVQAGGLLITPAWVIFGLTTLWYVTRGMLGLGVAVSAVVGALLWAGQEIATSMPSDRWAWGVGLFVVGWIIQFVGHYYEGRKPAFADDLVGLLVGPMFVVLEFLAKFGLFGDVMQHIEAQAGPTRLRDLAQPAG